MSIGWAGLFIALSDFMSIKARPNHWRRNSVFATNAVISYINCISILREQLAKRGWPEMIAKMLEAAKEPIGKTALMYKMGFSSASFRSYLASAQKSGFIEFDMSSRKYRTTVKGREYLEVYNSLCDLANIEADLSEISKDVG